MPHLHTHSAPMRAHSKPNRDRDRERSEKEREREICTKCHEHGPRYGQGILIRFDGFDTGYYQILARLLDNEK